MALNVTSPFIHVEDSNGNPYVGAKLYVYEVGTTTKSSIYTDDALSTAADNPATSDAAGNFPRLYIAAGSYKLRAETSGGVLIWEYDDCDTGLSSGSGALPIAKGGTGATTAAAARTSLDVPSNSELTTLSTTITALSNTIQNIVSSPQGRLSATSGAVVATSDVTAGTAVYYGPAIGYLCPIYDGTQFNAKSFDELTLTLAAASHLASTIYDVFIALDPDDGSVIAVTGPAWATSTAGSGSRGTGAGSTELERKNGIYTNKFEMTAKNGSTSYTIGANKGTYVGSIAIGATAGQIICHTSYGQDRQWGIWNAYNRLEIEITGGDDTASWTPGTTARASNNDTDNSVTTLCGLTEENVFVEFEQRLLAQASSSSDDVDINIGIGVNSTSAISGTKGNVRNSVSSTSTSIITRATATARYTKRGAIGLNVFTAMEDRDGSGGTATAYGGVSNMRLSARWRG